MGYGIGYSARYAAGMGLCSVLDTVSYTMLDIVLDTVQTENWTIIKEVACKNVSGVTPLLVVSTRV